jgi:hypothetical protein
MNPCNRDRFSGYSTVWRVSKVSKQRFGARSQPERGYPFSKRSDAVGIYAEGISVLLNDTKYVAVSSNKLEGPRRVLPWFRIVISAENEIESARVCHLRILELEREHLCWLPRSEAEQCNGCSFSEIMPYTRASSMYSIK